MLSRAVLDSASYFEERRQVASHILVGPGMSRFFRARDRDVAMTERHRYRVDEIRVRDMMFGMRLQYNAIADPLTVIPQDDVYSARVVSDGFGSVPVWMVVENNPSRLGFGVSIFGGVAPRRTQYMERFSYAGIVGELSRPGQFVPTGQQVRRAPPVYFDIPDGVPQIPVRKQEEPPAKMSPMRIAWLT